MTLFDMGVKRSARISDDGLYRYELRRRWSNDSPTVTFVMLNPSTADAEVDDPTIRRCVGFAKAWGMSGVCVVNLYALRATDPRDLWRADDPVGPDNDAYLTAGLIFAAIGYPIVAAWGAHARPDRVRRMLDLPGASHLQCLGVTKDGAPRHPLYLRGDAQLRPWPVPATEDGDDT